MNLIDLHLKLGRCENSRGKPTVAWTPYELQWDSAAGDLSIRPSLPVSSHCSTCDQSCTLEKPPNTIPPGPFVDTPWPDACKLLTRHQMVPIGGPWTRRSWWANGWPTRPMRCPSLRRISRRAPLRRPPGTGLETVQRTHRSRFRRSSISPKRIR